MTEIQDLKESIKEYARTLKRIEQLTLTIQELSEDLNRRIIMMRYRMTNDSGAHCTKCGDPVLGKEDGRCMNCI